MDAMRQWGQNGQCEPISKQTCLSTQNTRDNETQQSDIEHQKKSNIKQHHVTHTAVQHTTNAALTNSYTAATVREGVTEVRWHSRTKEMHGR